MGNFLVPLTFYIVLSVCTLQISASCMDGQSNNNTVCIDKEGFYYLLGNGSWDISLTEGDGLSARDTFLKYLETSNCLSSVSQTHDIDYCYCELGFPLPRHPITQRLLLLPTLGCKRQLYRYSHNSVWQLSNRYIEQCKFQGPILFPFLCVSKNNLRETGVTYNNPRALSKNYFFEKVQRKREHFNWRNASSTAAKTETGPSVTRAKTVAKKKSQGNNENVTAPVPIEAKLLEGIFFSVTTENETEVDHVTVELNPVNNQTIYFTAPTECLSRHRKWDVFPPCTYTLSTDGISDCYTLRVAINITIGVIFQHVSNLDTQIIEEIVWEPYIKRVGNDSLENEKGHLTCSNLPRHLSAVEVWAEGTQVATVLSFDEGDEASVIQNSLNLTATATQKIIVAEEYTSLSRFWAKFHFGECLYRQCWRDFWNVIPTNMLQDSKSIVGNEDVGYFGLRYVMSLLIICFVALVRNCIVNMDEDILN